jgi:hypothetical protein
MKVQLNVLCDSLIRPLTGGEFTLEEGSNIADLMAHAIQRCGKPDPRALEFISYLQNNKPAQADSELIPDATVTVVKVPLGG